MQVATMFTLYELAGVVTNLAAGFLGAKWGIRFTLICGLTLQLVSYGLLFGWQDDWSQTQAIIYVTVAQMFAGIAKDLTKLGGKTVTKLVTPEDKDTQLFKLVSLLTGWKNSLKGVGYFLGSALLQVQYELALAVMLGLVLLAMPWAAFGLSAELGTAKKQNATLSSVFKTDNRNLNILSLARLFLFASRDFWFEVPLPFFLRSPACTGLGEDFPCEFDDMCPNASVCSVEGFCENINTGGGCGGLALDRVIVGAFLGGYIILYGQVQSWTPQLVTGPLHQTPPNKSTEVFWGMINSLPTLVAAGILQFGPWFDEASGERDIQEMTIIMVVIIVTFAIIFAINSSIHSYLVVAYASLDKIAVSVGFYYMSNAVGRLFGTIGSGLLYTYVGESRNDFAGTDAVAGLAACFFAGTACSFLAALITIWIDDDNKGLKCGPCLTLVSDSTRGNSELESKIKELEEKVKVLEECYTDDVPGAHIIAQLSASRNAPPSRIEASTQEATSTLSQPVDPSGKRFKKRNSEKFGDTYSDCGDAFFEAVAASLADEESLTEHSDRAHPEEAETSSLTYLERSLKRNEDPPASGDDEQMHDSLQYHGSHGLADDDILKMINEIDIPV